MSRTIRSAVVFAAVLVVGLASAPSWAGTETPAPCPSSKTTETVVPGLQHHVLCRGTVATEPSYRVLVGTFHKQSEASTRLEELRKEGFAVLPDSDGEDYRILTVAVPTRAEAEQVRDRLAERGFGGELEILQVVQDLDNPSGPWRIHVLEADPNKVRIRVAHAMDAAIGLETTADLAARHGALAAVNGGFFHMTGLLAGDCDGTLQIDGRLLSEPDRGRGTVGFYDSDGRVHAVFGRLSFTGEARLEGGATIPLDGVNRAREPEEVILYTPEFHRTTLTQPGGAEILLENGRITAIREGLGSSPIPPGGAVLSIGEERAREITRKLRPGMTIEIRTDVVPLLPDTDGEWGKVRFMSSAGPLLLWNGTRFAEPATESISAVFYLARHPRTAVGAKKDGTILLVTVDGRRPDDSVGMTIPELTDLMLELGCTSAVNLDGGGSTTMVVRDQIVNHPSSSSGPRRNGDGVLVFAR